MAIKVATSSGNFNTAGTWYTGTETNTGSINGASLGSTRYTAAFTAPNTTNACQGIIVSLYSLPTSSLSSFTAQLQEYNGSTWNDCAGASMTINESDLDAFRSYARATTISLHLYFKFGTPYTYTTTSAGYYRVKLSRAVGSTLLAVYASTVTGEVWGVIVDDRTGAPASSDTCYVVGVTGTKTTVTLDGSCSCGPTVTTDGNDYSLFRPDLSTNWGLCIGYQGQVIPDSTQNTTLTMNGSAPIVVAGGQLNFGTASSPYTASYTAQIVYNPKTAYSCGIRVYGYNASLEHFSMVGQSKTYKTTYVSGTGVTGSELVVADATGWAVGDLIGISGDTYNKHEFKYIKTIASTTITLADSVGGAESALANTHYAADWVLNLSRNVKMVSSGAGKFWFGYLSNNSTTAGIMKYAEFSSIGGNSGSRYAFFLSQTARSAVNVEGCSVHEIINSTNLSQPLMYAHSSAIADNTYKNNVHFVAALATVPYVNTMAKLELKNNLAANVTNNYFVGGRYNGCDLYGYGATYDNFHVRNANASYSSSTTYSGIYVSGGANVTLQNCTANACRSHGMGISTGVNNLTVKNCSFGTVYANSANGDITLYTAGSYSTALFDNVTLTSSGGWYFYAAETNGYEVNAGGSQYAFQDYNASSGDHRIYKPEGYIQRTAAGLADTTVRTTGGSCLRFRPNNTINRLEWSQYVPVGDVSAQTMTVGVWCKINSATYYAGTKQMPRLTVNYDNGTTAYTEAAETTDWQFLTIPVTATTSYPEWTLTVSALTDATTMDADVYFTDFAILYPAGYQLKLGELAYFAQGRPLNPTIATNLSPADVWAVSTSGLTGDGTIGKFVTKLLTVAKFLGLK